MRPLAEEPVAGGPAMRIRTIRSGIAPPSVAAGVIYFVIAFATGASVAGSMIGGLAVAIVAVVIGILFRAVYTRRVASRRK
jgi:hypothetical protein